jgi:hypothetical protein
MRAPVDKRTELAEHLEVLGDDVEAAAERGIGGALPIRDLLNRSRRIPAVSRALETLRADRTGCAKRREPGGEVISVAAK